MERYPNSSCTCSRRSTTTGSSTATRLYEDRIRRRCDAGRWVPVGGSEAQLQACSRWQVAGSAASPRTTILRAGARATLWRVLEPGCVRLQRPAAGDHARGRDRVVPRGSFRGTVSTRRTTTLSPGRASTGSEVSSHFPPADTYNATVQGLGIPRRRAEYKDHDRSNLSLWCGGGGPTRMLERLRRVADLQGLPRTALRDVGQVFRHSGDGHGRPLPTMVGELLLRVSPRHLHHSGPDQKGNGKASGSCVMAPSCCRPRSEGKRRRPSGRATGRVVVAV